jgi:hypothetical protein
MFVLILVSKVRLCLTCDQDSHHTPAKRRAPLKQRRTALVTEKQTKPRYKHQRCAPSDLLTCGHNSSPSAALRERTRSLGIIMPAADAKRRTGSAPRWSVTTRVARRCSAVLLWNARPKVKCTICLHMRMFGFIPTVSSQHTSCPSSSL